MKKIIYTHAGQAHADELFAIAIVIWMIRKMYPNAIIEVRRVHTLPDKLELGCWLVDIGMFYGLKESLQIMGIDHHQDDPIVKNKCAATLAAALYAPELLEDALWGRFLKRVELQDNKGLRIIQEEYGNPKHEISALLFSEWLSIRRFETDPVGEASKIADAIADFYARREEVEAAREWLRQPGNCGVLEIAGATVMCLNKDPRLDGHSLSVVKTAQNNMIEAARIDVCLGWDERSPGARTLFRTSYGTDKGIDFTRIPKCENLIFAHQSGFLATLASGVTMQQILQYICDAMVKTGGHHGS